MQVVVTGNDQRYTTANVRTAAQRHFGLYLTGRRVDPLGDDGKRSHARRHRNVLTEMYRIEAAIATCQVLMGDKQKMTDGQRSTYDFYNDTHILDILNVNGAHDGSPLLIETKVSSPLTKSGPTHSAVSHVGHRFPFGNTEDELRITVLGREGREGNHAFEHETGQGFVAPVEGQYADALRKGFRTICAVVEVFGGITPEYLRHIRRRSREHHKMHSLSDDRYADSPEKSAFAHYHIGQISAAAALTDAQSLNFNTGHSIVASATAA
jgi:hypothetical protein